MRKSPSKQHVAPGFPGLQAGLGSCPSLTSTPTPVSCRAWPSDPPFPMEELRPLHLPPPRPQPCLAEAGSGLDLALDPDWQVPGSQQGKPAQLGQASPPPSPGRALPQLSVRISAQTCRVSPQQVWSFQSENLLRFQQVRCFQKFHLWPFLGTHLCRPARQVRAV